MPGFASCRPAACSRRPVLLSSWAAALVVVAAALSAAPARAAEPAGAVLADFQAHGYRSPVLALERLQGAPASATDTASPDFGWRQQSALADFALRADDQAAAQAALDRLKALAERGDCEPCGAALRMRQLQQARAAPPAELRKRLAMLGEQPQPADAKLQFDWHLARAHALEVLGDYDGAIADGLKASEIATLNDRPADLVESLELLAGVNASRRDMRRAGEYARQGMALAREIGHHYALVRLLVTHSYGLAVLKEQTERKAVLEELLALTESTRGLQPVRLNTLINLSNLSNDLRAYPKAVDYALQAERAAKGSADPNGHAFAIVNRGVAWVHLGRVDEGLALVKASIEIAERTGNQRELADLVEQQVNVFEAAGRPQAALQALRHWVALQAELTTSQREQAVAQLQESFNAQQRAREIEHLRLDNARREAELQLRTWREIAWAAAAVGVALLAFITWQRLARSRSINRGLRSDVARLADESHHDPLTAACNRRFGEALLQRLADENAALSDAGRRPVSLLLLDVDHFKRVNDTLGHAAGDVVLVTLVQRLQSMLRDGDAVVRWGGEEFLLVLPGTDEAGLRKVAGRVLEALGHAPVALPQGQRLAVRASAGGIVWRGGAAPAATWAHALSLADEALYQAKSDGRNRAVLALPDATLLNGDEDVPLARLVAEGRTELAAVNGVPLDTPAAAAPTAQASPATPIAA